MRKKLGEGVELEKINKLVMGRRGAGDKSNCGAGTVPEVPLAASEAEAVVTRMVTLSACWQYGGDCPPSGSFQGEPRGSAHR